MTASKTTKIVLIGSFLFSIYLVGATQAILEIYQGEHPQCLDLFMHEPTQKNLRTYESDMEKSSWFSQKLQPVMRLMQFIILKETGDKALLGNHDWFFYRPGAQYLIEPLPKTHNPGNSIQEVVSAVTDFRNQLQERGIQLIVVPAPGKASVYPEYLTSSSANSERPVNAHTLDTIDALQKKGIDVFDLQAVFQQEKINSSLTASQENLYLAQDTHWSPQGLQYAALSLAKKIIDSGLIQAGSINYKRIPITLKRHGDVLRMMNIPFTTQMYSPETIQCSQIVLENSGQPYTDDPQSPLLIIGDSFLRIFERDDPKSAGFISQLAYELKQPLASIVSDGGASTLVRQELARKPELLQNKKLVIWEFVERDIRFGTEGWQKVTLRKG